MKKLILGLGICLGFGSIGIKAEGIRHMYAPGRISSDFLMTGTNSEFRNAAYDIFGTTVALGTKYFEFTPSSFTFRNVGVIASDATTPFQIFAANGVTNLMNVNNGGALTAGGVVNGAGFTTAGNVVVDPLSKVMLDGGGDTYLIQSSANHLDIVAGGTTNFRVNAASATVYGNTVLGDAVTDIITFIGLPQLPPHATPRSSVTPTEAGQQIYNSTLLSVCFSTGTVASSWVRIEAPTTACQ